MDSLPKLKLFEQDMGFSEVELTMSLDDFAERILGPAMDRLEIKKVKEIPVWVRWSKPVFRFMPFRVQLWFLRLVLDRL